MEAERRQVTVLFTDMYLGKLCEIGPAEQVFETPAHPYTSLLLQAIPSPDPDTKLMDSIAAGEPPSPYAPPSGCRFHTRCPSARALCTDEEPIMQARFDLETAEDVLAPQIKKIASYKAA